MVLQTNVRMLFCYGSGFGQTILGGELCNPGILRMEGGGGFPA